MHQGSKRGGWAHGLVGVVLLGCGGSTQQPDAAVSIDAPPDMPIDAPSDGFGCISNGTTGSVIVDGPSAESGGSVAVTVLRHDVSGTVVSRSPVLAADAMYTVDVDSCGMISVYDFDGVRRRLFTWTGVQPGDHLVHPRRLPSLADYFVETNITAVTDATAYDLTMICPPDGRGIQQQATAGTQTPVLRCVTGTTQISVLARADTPSGSSFAVLDSVAPTTATLDTWQAPASTVAISVSGISTSLTPAAGLARLYRRFPAGTVAEYGASQKSLSSSVSFDPVPVLGGPGVTTINLSAGSQPSWSIVHTQAFVTPPSTLALAVGTDTLPLLTASVDSSSARPTVMWSADGALKADGIAIDIRYGMASWRLVAPAVPGSAKYPEIPTDLQIAKPIQSFAVTAVDVEGVSGYGMLRPQPAAMVGTLGLPAPSSTAYDSLP
jgi:hypothetical protein